MRPITEGGLGGGAVFEDARPPQLAELGGDRRVAAAEPAAAAAAAIIAPSSTATTAAAAVAIDPPIAAAAAAANTAAATTPAAAAAAAARRVSVPVDRRIRTLPDRPGPAAHDRSGPRRDLRRRSGIRGRRVGFSAADVDYFIHPATPRGATKHLRFCSHHEGADT